ncbi:MAG: FHA domain-containing protein [Betaproteobacteria bacterium HGW-Betaproteobacteria-22]|nr:MAG: FHA domain-containing protein [Betaproteobacteria bacterium HGW-Betaproteobacteria-22]
MAKLILTLDGAYLSEKSLTKVRTGIGRRPANDFHLDNLAVSGDHAVILKIGSDYYIEDLDSTNGTRVNNEPVKRHALKNGDLIDIGKFQLKFLNDANADATASAFAQTMLMHPSAIRLHEKSLTASVEDAKVAEPAAVKPSSALNSVPENSGMQTAAVEREAKPDLLAKVQVLNGASSGRELVLNKALTTLGKVGVQVAVITRRANGYFITHVEGKVRPSVNGVTTGLQAHALSDHDVIELAGVKMEFYLSKQGS